MVLVTVHCGIIFIEGEHPRAKKIIKAKAELGGFGAQLRNLNDLKSIMANKAKQNKCNCIVDFTYGQKTKIISLDDVVYVGEGFYAALSEADYNSIISRF